MTMFEGIDKKIEGYFNRGKHVENRAFNSDTTMEYNLMYFIMFANVGAIILLGFLYAMLSVDELITTGIAGIVFGSPVAFFMTSSIAITLGNVFLLLFSKTMEKRKVKEIGINVNE